jgi:hypothetical protein
MYSYKEQYPGASQQSIANYFTHLWGKTIHQLALCRYILSEKKEMRTKTVKCEVLEGRKT